MDHYFGSSIVFLTFFWSFVWRWAAHDSLNNCTPDESEHISFLEFLKFLVVCNFTSVHMQVKWRLMTIWCALIAYHPPVSSWKAFSNASSIDVVRFAPRALEHSQILTEEHNKGKHAVHRESQRRNETRITRVWVKHADLSHIFSGSRLNAVKVLQQNPEADYEETTSPWNREVFR